MFAAMIRSRRFALACLVAMLLGGGALAAQTTPQPVPPGFGMVGIANGQTARLNVVNLATVDPTTGAVPPPCRARLQFVDAAGNVLASRNVAPEAEHARFLDYVPTFLPVNTVGDVASVLRAQIRAVVSTDDGLLPPPCRITVELFDNATGRTQVVLYPPPCRGAQCRIVQ